MMDLEYYIVGGYLKIQKNAFVQEMLSKDSSLRAILNWKSTGDFAGKHPTVSEADENEIITINFNYTVHVKLDDISEKLLSDLKAKYKEKVKGKVTCRAMLFYSMFHFDIDLNSEDEKVRKIENSAL